MRSLQEREQTTEEQWYWHSLYFQDLTIARDAYQQIRRELDRCADLSTIPYVTHQHLVSFSTPSQLVEQEQERLTSRYQPGEQSFNDVDDEELLTIFHRVGQESHPAVCPPRGKSVPGLAPMLVVLVVVLDVLVLALGALSMGLLALLIAAGAYSVSWLFGSEEGADR